MTFPPEPYADDPWSWTRVIFRPLVDWPGYGVDTDGGVWTCKATQGFNGSGWRRLRPTPTGKYLSVSLGRDRRFKTIQVQTIILSTFIGPRPPGMECCHRNGKHRDNRLSNLRWGTRKENMEDQYRHGTRVMGESHGTSILTESQVREIKALLAEGFPKLWIAQLFGVQDGTIHFIAKGETWKHVK